MGGGGEGLYVWHVCVYGMCETCLLVCSAGLYGVCVCYEGMFCVCLECE